MRSIRAQRSVAVVTRTRLDFVRRILRTSYHVDSAHSEGEILTFVQAVAKLPSSVPGVLVEAGCYRGGGTAKLSWLAALTGRRLVLFDSFRGIPPNAEIMSAISMERQHSSRSALIPDRWRWLSEASKRYGRPEVCQFIEGWFEETMPAFSEPIAAAYIDVDLAMSTRTCLKHLYPLLSPGGVLMSQDAHLPLVIQVLEDDQFWRHVVGAPRPHIDGLRTRKLVSMRKPDGVLHSEHLVVVAAKQVDRQQHGRSVP